MKRSVLIPPLLHRVEILIFAIGILVGGKLGDITVLSFLGAIGGGYLCLSVVQEK